MRAEQGWERDLRINERDREEPLHSKGTSSLMYDAHGEPVSDEVWDKRLEQENK